MIADRIKQKTDTQQKKKLKHNTARNQKNSFILNDIDECKNNVNERNKVLFSKAETEKFGKMGNENKEKKSRLLLSGITR